MAPLTQVLIIVAMLGSAAGADCDGADNCLQEKDVTSLVQLKKTVKQGSERDVVKPVIVEVQKTVEMPPDQKLIELEASVDPRLPWKALPPPMDCAKPSELFPKSFKTQQVTRRDTETHEGTHEGTVKTVPELPDVAYEDGKLVGHRWQTTMFNPTGKDGWKNSGFKVAWLTGRIQSVEPGSQAASHNLAAGDHIRSILSCACSRSSPCQGTTGCGSSCSATQFGQYWVPFSQWTWIWANKADAPYAFIMERPGKKKQRREKVHEKQPGNPADEKDMDDDVGQDVDVPVDDDDDDEDDD